MVKVKDINLIKIINLLNDIFKDPQLSLEWLLCKNPLLNDQPINLIESNPEKVIELLQAITDRSVQD